MLGAARIGGSAIPALVSTLAGAGATSGYADATGTSARFDKPHGVVRSTDNAILYVADRSNKRVRKVDVASGAVTTLAGDGNTGSDNGAAATASFNTPAGLALSSDDARLYVADEFNHRIRLVVTSTGVVSTFVGSSSGSNDGVGGRLSRPWGVVLTGNDAHMYVSEIPPRPPSLTPLLDPPP